jgi:hypothetical protein
MTTSDIGWTMPDERFAVPNVWARGSWRAHAVDGAATLFVESSEVVLRLDDGGEELTAPLGALSGASWRLETLSLRGAEIDVHLQGGATLDQAWFVIMRRACAAPEVARGLRALGTRGGGDPELQSRFFAPFLQARRCLEEPEPIDWQVSRFDVPALTQRTGALLTTIATERFPTLPSHRRALEAELFDAAESLLEELKTLDREGRAIHTSDDSDRFVAWRSWSGQLRRVFVEADRSWSTIVSILARR